MQRFWLCWICAGLFSPAAALAKTFLVTPDNVSDGLPRLQPGDTLLLAAGVYRTTLSFRFLEGKQDAPIVIKAESGPGSVVIRGSDVLESWALVDGNLYVHQLNLEPSQVFVDGMALQQWGGTVFDGFPLNEGSAYARLHPNEGGIWPGRRALKSLESLPEGAFYFDARKKRLYVRAARDLRAKAVVEASQRPHGFFAQHVRHLVIEGIAVQHANTSVTGRGGALVVWGDDVVIRQVAANWNDLVGLQFGGDRIVVDGAQASYNGQMGVSGRGRFNTVRKVVATHNNRRGFNKWWEAGGFKFIGELDAGLLDSKIEDCQALHNAGDGFWFDWRNARVALLGSLAAYNQGFGVHYEASSEGLIDGNVVLGNGQRGIYLSSSEQTRVSHNLVVGNGLEGIVSIWDRNRADHKGRQFGARFNVIENNVLAWNKEGAVTVPSDADARSDGNVFLGDGAASRFSMDFPGPLNPPVYGLQAWIERSGQDRRSWWQNQPVPDGWRRFLSGKRMDAQSLADLLDLARRDPNDGSVVAGDKWRKGEGAIRAVGPRHLGSVD